MTQLRHTPQVFPGETAMSALNEIQLRTAPADNATIQILKDQIRVELWEWIARNGDRKVYTLSFWIVRKTFYVRDLHPVFELLLGPKPSYL